MNDPKTADQINSQVLGKVEIAKQITHDKFDEIRDQMKRNIALRLLVEKWRENANFYDYTQEHESTNHTVSTLRQCAKELENALFGL